MCQRRILFIFIWMFRVLTICFSFQKRTIIFHGFSNCPADEKNIVHFNGSVAHIESNKYDVEGIVKIDEYITGPLEVCTTQKGTLITLPIYYIIFSSTPPPNDVK